MDELIRSLRLNMPKESAWARLQVPCCLSIFARLATDTLGWLGTAVGRYDESSRGRQEQMRDKMQERADAAGP